MTRWDELVGALTLLTRLNAAAWARTHPPQAACVWAYPLAGLVVGAAGAAVLAGAMALGLSQPLACVWALAATTLLTGGLHEDGLADTADGFGGGRTVDHKLAIMRDSRIGSFGALALVFSLVLRGLALATATKPCLALLLASVLGRGAMLLPLILLRPARLEGLGSTLQGAGLRACTGLAIAALAGLWSPAACLAALATGLLVTRLAAKQVGGYTGDVFGAAEQLTECAVLSVLT